MIGFTGLGGVLAFVVADFYRVGVLPFSAVAGNKKGRAIIAAHNGHKMRYRLGPAIRKESI